MSDLFTFDELLGHARKIALNEFAPWADDMTDEDPEPDLEVMEREARSMGRCFMHTGKIFCD